MGNVCLDHIQFVSWKSINRIMDVALKVPFQRKQNMPSHINGWNRTQTSSQRVSDIEAYSEWIGSWTEEGWTLFFISFMFRPIAGSEALRMLIMEREIETFYTTLLTRVVRRPRATANAAMLPRLVAFPDYPVPKSIKISLRDASVNDGLHLHGIIGMPPRHRLRDRLDLHLIGDQSLYVRADRHLSRIDAQLIRETPECAADYLLKGASRGRVELDRVILLPRSRDEVRRTSPDCE